MKWIRRIFDFYLDASIHVALAVTALVLITSQTLNIRVYDHLLFFIFFGSISCYNFMKYGLEAKKYLLVANQYHKGIQFLSFITLGFAIYHCHFFNLNTWLGIGFLVFLTGLYALPILPKAKNLRSLGGLKIFVVGLVWAGTTVILPVLVISEPLTWDVYVETIQCFILVFILLIPFEIRDMVYDQEDLRTLPQRFGVAKTKIIGAFATLLYFFMTFLKDDIGKDEIFLKGILYLTLGIVMFTTKRKQSKYFASFWIEAIPIFWLGLWIISEKMVNLYT